MITPDDHDPGREPDDLFATLLRPEPLHLNPPPGRYEAILRGATRRRLARAAATAGAALAVVAAVALLAAVPFFRDATGGPPPSTPVTPAGPPSPSGGASPSPVTQTPEEGPEDGLDEEVPERGEVPSRSLPVQPDAERRDRASQEDRASRPSDPSDPRGLPVEPPRPG